MPSRALRLDEYWPRVAHVLPDFPPDQQETAVTIYRALAKGAPLSTEAVAQALRVPAQTASDILTRHPLRAFVYAEQGQIVGFGGLAVAPMHHEFRVEGRTLWTWCAWDSLFIPAVLGHTADVSSPDPQTREIVRLRVSPSGIEHVAPSSAVVSFLLPEQGDFDESADNVIGRFCHYVFFFTSSESADRWRVTHPDTLLYSPADAFELGARLVTKQFGHALRRPSPAPTG